MGVALRLEVERVVVLGVAAVMVEVLGVAAGLVFGLKVCMYLDWSPVGSMLRQGSNHAGCSRRIQ